MLFLTQLFGGTGSDRHHVESPDDGTDRGLAVFFGCADPERQFEFVLKELVNAPKFQGLEHDKNPIAGDHDGTYNMTIQQKPIKKTHQMPGPACCTACR